MVHSVKSNLALRRGRNHLFDRNVDLKTRRYVGEVRPVAAQVREKFRQQLAEEKRRDRKALIYSIVATVLLGCLAYSFMVGQV